MSWKYPFSQLTKGGVVEIDGLNRGFLQAVNEVQGQLNEHNWIKGAVSSSSVAPIAPATLELNYTPDTFVVEDAFFSYVAPAVNIAFGSDAVVNRTTNTFGTWLSLGDPSVAGWNTVFYVPGDTQWHLIGEGSLPCGVSFSVEEETQVYILLSLQWLGLATGSGSMFGLRLNGNLLTESIIGSGDLQIEPYNKSRAGDTPNPERMEASPNLAPTSELGWPFCVEATVTVPPGQVVIEGVVRRSAVDQSPNGVGSRELIVLNLLR